MTRSAWAAGRAAPLSPACLSATRRSSARPRPGAPGSANAASEAELWVGCFRRGSGEAGIAWPEAVDEALCVGWIDGRRRSLDARRYRIRFTPRRAASIWSTVYVARVAELEAEGRMRPAGRAAFARRRASRSGVYSHEQAREPELDAAQRARCELRPGAWAFLQAQSASYRKAALWWVVSAKRADTRARRLEALLAECAAGRQLAQLARTRGRAANG